MNQIKGEQDRQEVFNLESLARYVGISTPTAQRLVNQDGFPAFRMGRRWVIPRRAVDEWLQRNAQERVQL